MNKLTKSALAAGAGAVLLLGGSGTYMIWNDADTVEGAPISAGQLDVTAKPGTWTLNGTSIDSIDGHPIVPGDRLVYTTTLSVTAQGESLRASLSLTPDAISPASSTNDADVKLDSALTSDAVLALSSTPTGMVTDVDGDGTYAVTAGSAPKTEDMTVTVTLTFPYTDTDQNAAQLGRVSLNKMDVVLTQTPTV